MRALTDGEYEVEANMRARVRVLLGPRVLNDGFISTNILVFYLRSRMSLRE